MPAADAVAQGAHVLTVCNACRYCEQFCPVFPAMERRRTFEPHDLAHLANLCHNCGECLYACQYAPPHPFGINVPRTLARLRRDSYAEYAWPRALARLSQRAPLTIATALAVGFSVVLLAAVARRGVVWPSDGRADFYGVVPHDVLVALFGGVFAFALAALAAGVARFAHAIGAPRASIAAYARALRDAVTLRHLHGSGADCVSAEEVRDPWRRWCHHAVLWGFALCTASTSVAAVYHDMFGWVAPYAVTSVPVMLGTAGGSGLLAGAIGLSLLRVRRDPLLADPRQSGDDASLLALLLATSATGLALLACRATPAMALLLVVHLGSVLALFVLLPYGKFVHGAYRLAALVADAAEHERESTTMEP